MKNRVCIIRACSILFFCACLLGLSAQEIAYNADDAFDLMQSTEPLPFARNTHPDAQWFPEAGLGLFVHWGIHSVAALDPSWAMLKNCPWHSPRSYVGREAYYRLADEFAPSAYDPEKWVLAAKNAGFQYVVLTTKHHDGYCMWPTEYSEWGTLQQMDGRDLIRPYVDACRKYGMKIGFYFSQRDWGSSLFHFPYVDHDFTKRLKEDQYPEEGNQEQFDQFFDNTIRQLSELLTRYGKIDLLWFDSVDWLGVDNYSDRVHAWLRKVQPALVVNQRWYSNDPAKPFGDYMVEEVNWRSHMEEPPVEEGTWWEFCESWSGHWGYSPLNEFKSQEDVIRLLVYARAFGGNYLLNIGPAPDGTMRSGYYKECLQLSEWMKVNGESVIGTGPVLDWQVHSDLPMTQGNNCYYIHMLGSGQEILTMKGMEKPERVEELDGGSPIDFRYSKNVLEILLPVSWKYTPDRVIKLYY
jgi:alpha-L-fucosidase